MKRIIILLLLISISILYSINVNAVCVVTFDKVTYSKTETITATMTCDAGNEKNNDYKLNWTNRTTSGGAIEIEVDPGTTPSTAGQAFVETFIIPSDFVGDHINATLTGTNLEGDDNATIAAAAANQLILSNIIAKGTFLGLSTSINLQVDDENGKEITGGTCTSAIKDPTNDEVLFEDDATPISNNELHVSTILNYESFREAKDYVWEVGCFCGSASGNFQCIDEDGTDVTNSQGATNIAFTTSEWFTFLESPLPLVNASNDNALTNLSAGFDEVRFRVNITNKNPTLEPLEFDIRTQLIKNDTRQAFGDIQMETRTASFRNGSAVFVHTIDPSAETGKYFVRVILDVKFKNSLQVAQVIEETQIFNITAIPDLIRTNSFVLRDFFGNELNTSAATQSSTSIPTSNFTDPFTLGTEGFFVDICLNLTNQASHDIITTLDSLVLENPSNGYNRVLIDETNEVARQLDSGDTSEQCFRTTIPLGLDTHSDYRFAFRSHRGDTDGKFLCGDT